MIRSISGFRGWRGKEGGKEEENVQKQMSERKTIEGGDRERKVGGGEKEGKKM